MVTLLVSASDIIEKTGIDLTVLQSAIDAGCYCYSRANACHVKMIREAPTPTSSGIDLNLYRENFGQYEQEAYEAYKRLDHIVFKPKELHDYIESEFGKERAMAFTQALVGCEQEQTGDVPLKEVQQDRYENKTIDPRKHNSYLKIIAAAICTDGNRHDLIKRGLAGKLTQRMQQLGISLSEDAVRRSLREVFDFLEENCQ